MSESEDVSPQPPAAREYLGDGLYVEYDGYQFKLAANDGIRDYAAVFLDPRVLHAFVNYVKRVGVFA